MSFTAVLRDLTERKLAQWLDSDRGQVMEMVAHNEAQDLILERIARMIERQRPDARASVMVLREGVMRDAAGPSLPPDFRVAVDGLAAGPEGCVWGLAVQRKQMVITPDIASDEQWVAYRQLAVQHGLAASCAVPILGNPGEAMGALVIYYKQPTTPTPRDLELLEACTRLAAVAIEHQQLADKLVFQASHDPLTGLPNRALLEDRLQQAMACAARNGEQLGVFFIDVDHFKTVNDTLGHHTGDLLLREIAQRLRGRVRATDTLMRMGGDEFTLVAGSLKTRRGASDIANKLIDCFKAPFEVAGHELFVTASIGIGVYPDDGRDAGMLQRSADAAMYRAKGQGRAGYQFFDLAMNESARERLAMEGQLRNAIENNELEVYYQPRVDREGQVVGLEALLRWHHPRLGLVPPVKFIPLAEESGLIVPLGTWVLKEACRQCRQWQIGRDAPLRMGVNVSALQFAQADFTANVIAALASANLDPSLLELELTESLLMRNMEDTAAKLREIRSLGVGIAIDDFGTGYSSLSYLQRLPIDTLKIDRSFVQEVKEMPRDNEMAIIRAIASLGKTLHMRVIAEGVETQVHKTFLLSIGCDGLQGYLFSPPRPAAQIEHLLPAASLPMPEPLKISA